MHCFTFLLTFVEINPGRFNLILNEELTSATSKDDRVQISVSDKAEMFLALVTFNTISYRLEKLSPRAYFFSIEGQNSTHCF